MRGCPLAQNRGVIEVLGSPAHEGTPPQIVNRRPKIMAVPPSPRGPPPSYCAVNQYSAGSPTREGITPKLLLSQSVRRGFPHPRGGAPLPHGFRTFANPVLLPTRECPRDAKQHKAQPPGSPANEGTQPAAAHRGAPWTTDQHSHFASEPTPPRRGQHHPPA